MTTADASAQRRPARAAAPTSPLPDAVAGTRPAGSIRGFLALVGGLAAGGVATALALSGSSNEDGAQESRGSAGSSIRSGVTSSLVWHDSATDASQGNKWLVTPSTGAPDGVSHGS
jgi:hypothetical protein